MVEGIPQGYITDPTHDTTWIQSNLIATVMGPNVLLVNILMNLFCVCHLTFSLLLMKFYSFLCFHCYTAGGDFTCLLKENWISKSKKHATEALLMHVCIFLTKHNIFSFLFKMFCFFFVKSIHIEVLIKLEYNFFVSYCLKAEARLFLYCTFR